ncbi:hypothetical protein E4U56_007918 [Claviceps arundinis]|uniref:Uncharacterized protein n=1 Tax=Claviceps arundinis TaxID=1623583 RepID=A0A9P7MU50_9HYPO|nr:hypothetical protein E4U56_007918 [Claviceps arundinis]
MRSHQPSSASDEQRPHLASAVSQLSLSRTERYNQFTADSSSCMSKDEFPIFSRTGDVEITIRGAIAADGVEAVSKTYLLHQDTLARCSGFFAASTSSQWSKAQSDPARVVKGLARDIGDDGDRGSGSGSGSSSGGDNDGGGSAQNTFGPTRPKRKWKFELDHGTEYLDTPMLVQTGPLPAQQEGTQGSGRAGDSQSSSPLLSGPGSGGPAASHTISSSLQPEDDPPVTPNGSQRVFDEDPDMRDMLLGMDKALLRNYDNLFRIFYNCRPILDNVDAFYACIEGTFVLRLADQYDALAVVRPWVEHHLLQFQSTLWEHISKSPHRCLEVGYLARSKVIFKEALIHVVGLWYLCIPKRPNLDVPDFVLDIVEDKVYELQEKASRVEGQLFRLSLTTEQGRPVRPANNYLDWLVVSLFRQWLADKTKPQIWPACDNSESESDNSHHSDEINVFIPPFGIYQVYQKLGSDSPSAFLGHDECEAFLALNPQLYTPENLVRFEKRMADLKVLARDLVRPLLHNSLELNVDSPDMSEAWYKPSYFTCTTVEDDDIPWPLDPYIPLE